MADYTQGTIIPADNCSLVEIEYRGVVTPVTVFRDLTDATKVLTGYYDQNGGGPYNTITADGVYQFFGGGKMKWTCSTPTTTANVRFVR